jgi:hypothetical protein
MSNHFGEPTPAGVFRWWLNFYEHRYQSNALISEMHARIEDLRTQLEAERQAHSEAGRLLAAALERIPPQLEAP